MTPTLVPYKIKVGRAVRGTLVHAGQEVWAIKFKDLFFIWSYVHKETAEQVARRVTYPQDPGDRGANWRTNTDALGLAYRRPSPTHKQPENNL